MEAATATTTSSQSRQRKLKRKRAAALASDPQLDRLNSLAWNPLFPRNNDEDDNNNENDPFAMLATGSNELEGGFLSLEEIDEADYGFSIPEPQINEKRNQKKELKLAENVIEEKKKKEEEEEDDGVGGGNGEVEVKKEKKKDKKKKKKKTKKNKKKEEEKEEEAVTENQNVEKPDTGLDTDVKDDDDVGEEDFDETEFYAWNELRLHPLLMKDLTAIIKWRTGQPKIGARRTGQPKMFGTWNPRPRNRVDKKRDMP